MKKFLFLIAFVLLPQIICGEIIIPQSTTASVLLAPGMFYDSGNYSAPHALIWDSTADVSNWTVTVWKGIGTPNSATAAIVPNATAGYLHSIKNTGGHGWELLLTPDDTNTRGTMIITAYQSGRFDMPPCHIVVCATDAYHEQVNGVLSGKIASATAQAASLHQITDGLIQQVTPYVVAGGRIIPSTGCTYPEFYRVMEGHMGRYLMLRSISLSDATPEMKLAVREDTPGQSTPAMEDALTYMSFASHYQVDGVTPTEHVWYWDISNLARERWYSFVCSIRKEGKWISGVGALIMNPTPELTLSETPLSETLFNSTMGEFISDVSQAFRNQGKGFSDIIVFRGQGNVDRSIPGTSSEASHSFASGTIYAVTIAYYDPFSEESLEYQWLNDQDSVFGTTSRWIELTEDVHIRAASDSVTLTAAGEE